jgi:hypothetical protein
MLEQLLQLVGAILVLAGFTLAQVRVLDPQSLAYLLLNAVGAAILATLALIGEQWGFLLLEGVWTIVSVAGLVARWASRAPGDARRSAGARP